MELKKRVDMKLVLIRLYLVALIGYTVYGLQPVEAARYDIATELDIPSIGLTADVTEMTLDDGKLNTPDTIVGSYSRFTNKTLLVGHSNAIFEDLKFVKVGEDIVYNGKVYRVRARKVLARESIDMNELLMSAKKDTLVIMTCAGRALGGGEATHRLLLTAVVE